MTKQKRPTAQADLFTPSETSRSIPSRRVRWQAAHRLIQTRFPPIHLFERIAPPEDWDHLIALEDMTNPRLRQEAGEISLVPVSRRVSGPGASIVMAPFTHCSTDRPSRFSDGTYGIYYAAQKFETALLEVRFHLERFHSATADPPAQTDYREYQGNLDAALHDLTHGDWRHLLSPNVDDYTEPQRLARELREAGSDGLIYPSVRHPGGVCLAAFWPDVVAIPKQTKHIAMDWDGERVTRWFDYQTKEWRDFRPPAPSRRRRAKP